MQGKQESVSRKLAVWSSELRYADIPADVVNLAKMQFLDALGVRIAAGRSEAGQAMKRVVEKLFPGSTAMQPGESLRYPLDAFFDGTLTACLDFDDTHDETLIHPSSAIGPALAATARSVAISGTDFVTALVAGYEVCCRIGVAATGQFHKKGFHPTGVIGAVGAAAAVARALGYDSLTTEHALGLAASIGGGLMQAIVDGTDARYVNSGGAALNGIMACTLAKEGFTGAGEPIDGKFGLLRAHTRHDTEPSLWRTTDMLGIKWEARGITPKPYPTGYVTHEFIDAMLALADEYDLHPEDVEDIECTVEEKAAQLVFIPPEQKAAPERSPAARVALPHILAEAVVFRDIGAASFTAKRMNDPRVRSLARKVRYRLGKTADDDQLAVTVRNCGFVVRKTARRIMTVNDIVEKFIANAEPTFGSEDSHAIADAVLSAERQSDFGRIHGLALEFPDVPRAPNLLDIHHDS